MSAPRGGHRFRTVATVYGQILTVSVVAALSEDAQAGPSEIFESVVLTMTVIAGRRSLMGRRFLVATFVVAASRWCAS